MTSKARYEHKKINWRDYKCEGVLYNDDTALMYIRAYCGPDGKLLVYPTDEGVLPAFINRYAGGNVYRINGFVVEDAVHGYRFTAFSQSAHESVEKLREKTRKYKTGGAKDKPIKRKDQRITVWKHSVMALFAEDGKYRKVRPRRDKDSLELLYDSDGSLRGMLNMHMMNGVVSELRGWLVPLEDDPNAQWEFRFRDIDKWRQTKAYRSYCRDAGISPIQSHFARKLRVASMDSSQESTG